MSQNTGLMKHLFIFIQCDRVIRLSFKATVLIVANVSQFYNLRSHCTKNIDEAHRIRINLIINLALFNNSLRKKSF